jgi:hypothetical protein
MANALYALHRVLILAALALGVLVTIYGGARYVRLGGRGDLALALFGASMTVGWSLYLRWFLRKASR